MAGCISLTWNCVGCDADGEVECQEQSPLGVVLAEITLQHGRLKPDCPLVYKGGPAISIWEKDK